MEFVKELHEARLIRTKGDLRYSFSDVCEYLYLIILTLDFLSRIKEGRKIAERYAQNTASYINYTEFRTSATDLYNLIYFVEETPERVEEIFGSEDSKKLRLITQIPRMELNRWLLKITDPQSRSLYFFFRLEQALNVKSSEIKDLRRMLSFKNPTDQDLRIISYKILNLFRHKMPLFDLKPELEQILGQGKYTYIK
jgi:hypothetical protein